MGTFFAVLLCVAVGDLPKGFEAEGGKITLPTGEQITGVPREVGKMVLVVAKERVGIYNPGTRKIEWKKLPFPAGATLTPIESSTGRPDKSVCFVQVRDMSTTDGEVKGVIRFKPPRSLVYFPVPVMGDVPAARRVLGWHQRMTVERKSITTFLVEGLPNNMELRLSAWRGPEALRVKKNIGTVGSSQPFEVQREINHLKYVLHETEEDGSLVVKEGHLVPKAEGKLDPVTRGVATWKYNALLQGKFQMNEFGGVEVAGPKYQEEILRCELILKHDIEPRETNLAKFVPDKLIATRRDEIEDELAELKKKQQTTVVAATSQEEEE